jgi:hypothetical protein
LKRIYQIPSAVEFKFTFFCRNAVFSLMLGNKTMKRALRTGVMGRNEYILRAVGSSMKAVRMPSVTVL